MNLHPELLTLSQTADLIRRGDLSPVALTEALLVRIEQLNPVLNAYLTVTAETARREAQAAERLIGTPEPPPLLGVPLALKDLFDVRGLATTAGSVIRADAIATEDAAVTARLRAAGAILLGKLNLHEWALGVTTNNPHFGPTRNPWDLERIPGGSSGGSAAAVAAGLCLGSIGSDTGGSIRIPASLCGIVGLKPTRGRVSLRGVVPLSWSLDSAGPMTRTVRDIALLLQVIAGYDPADPASADVFVDDYLLRLEEGLVGLKVGVPHDYFFDDLDAEVAAAVRAAIDELARLGAAVRVVRLPEARTAWDASSTILLCDAAAYHRDHLRQRPDEIGPDVRTRLETGAALSGCDYALARRTQAEWQRRLERLFEEIDILITPTTPIPAPRLDEAEALVAAFGLTRFTRPFNLANVPALSLPCGFTQSDLPIGLQLVGRPWSEAILLRAAYAYEQATPWHTMHPPL